jgi:hypothetical protein
VNEPEWLSIEIVLAIHDEPLTIRERKKPGALASRQLAETVMASYYFFDPRLNAAMTSGVMPAR